MRTPVVLFAAAVTATVEAQPASVGRDRPFVLTRVIVIDTRSGDTTREMSVSVLGNRITAIAPTSEFKPPGGFRVIDAAGKFLIPGLWDMHAHVGDPELWPANVTPAEFEAVFPVLIANGVTGVRDMGGGLEELHHWKERVRLGQLLGPRIVAAGPIVDGVFPAWQPILRVVTEAAGRDAVRSLARRGADLIKVYDSIPRETYFAMASEAARLGIPVAGHVPELVSAAEASDAGQRSIEHLSGILRTCSTLESELHQELVKAYAEQAAETPVGLGDPRVIESFSRQKCDALFARFVKNATWQCPTLNNHWRHAHARRSRAQERPSRALLSAQFQDVLGAKRAATRYSSRPSSRTGRSGFARPTSPIVRSFARCTKPVWAFSRAPTPGGTSTPSLASASTTSSRSWSAPVCHRSPRCRQRR
jgi:hypothetical protein